VETRLPGLSSITELLKKDISANKEITDPDPRPDTLGCVPYSIRPDTCSKNYEQLRYRYRYHISSLVLFLKTQFSRLQGQNTETPSEFGFFDYRYRTNIFIGAIMLDRYKTF
jgi:hypothetical protein